MTTKCYLAPLGETVLLWRLERGLTQDELARRAGVPRPNLSAVEQGKREVSLRTLRALAVALGITPGLLVDGVGPGGESRRESFSREALERIADAVVHGTPLRTQEERLLARLLQRLVRHRARGRMGQGRFPLRGTRASTAAWLRIRSYVPPEVIRSLIQRIADRERLT